MDFTKVCCIPFISSRSQVWLLSYLIGLSHVAEVWWSESRLLLHAVWVSVLELKTASQSTGPVHNLKFALVIYSRVCSFISCSLFKFPLKAEVVSSGQAFSWCLLSFPCSVDCSDLIALSLSNEGFLKSYFCWLKLRISVSFGIFGKKRLFALLGLFHLLLRYSCI